MKNTNDNLIFMCVREVYRQDYEDKKINLVVDGIGFIMSLGCLYWIIANDLLHGGWLVCIAVLVFMYVLVNDYNKFKKAKKKYEDSL